MYYVDTQTDRVDVFDYQHGTISNRRKFATIGRGRPDGIAVDADGGVWVALWDGYGVQRFGPDGTQTDLVEVPVRKVTACAFGGPNFDELWITTSREDESDPEPAAGAVFLATPHVRGSAIHSYGG